jgi:hypothetical protein
MTGRFLQAPAIGLIITAEGTWTFGSTTRAGGDYPLLLNGSTANGGWAASLQVTNGNLYAFAKSGGHYWIRFYGAWVDIGAVVPVQGTFATKVTIVPKNEDPRQRARRHGPRHGQGDDVAVTRAVHRLPRLKQPAVYVSGHERGAGARLHSQGSWDPHRDNTALQ